MGWKEKLSKHYTQSYLKKYGDRLAQVQGNVISAKVEEKTTIWILHRITATIIVRPVGSKTITKCVYAKKKWFKKPPFIAVSQGNSVLIQGLKGKKGKEHRETIDIMNIRNLSTKKDLVPMDESQIKQVKTVQRR